MKKNLSISFLFLAALVFGTSPALAAQSHIMAHHDHAAMNHSAMDHSPQAGSMDGHAEDLKGVIPSIKARGHGELGHGNPKGNISCEHHPLCPSDHICSLKNHQCDTVNDYEAYQTCAISSECGGGLPQQAVSTTVDHEFIIAFYIIQEINFSSYFCPPPMEASLAGFPGGLEHPPQSNS